MLTREEILGAFERIKTEENKFQVEELISKVTNLSDEQIQTVLAERKIKTEKDISKMVQKMVKKSAAERGKFEELNEVVSFGTTGRTIHVHLVPKDAHHMLTKEGLKEARASLIDAMEKIKVKIQTEKKYKKIENVYAVSDIMTGVVARWFKELGFDVKTLPIEEAKHDAELSKFYEKFKDKDKLGRANLLKEKLMSEEWEQGKDELKEKLGIAPKTTDFVGQLQSLNNTDGEVVQATEAIDSKAKEERDVKPEVIE